MEKAKGESGMELAFDKILTSSCEGERIDYRPFAYDEIEMKVSDNI